MGYTFFKILFVPVPPHYFCILVMGQDKDPVLIFLKVRKSVLFLHVLGPMLETNLC